MCVVLCASLTAATPSPVSLQDVAKLDAFIHRDTSGIGLGTAGAAVGMAGLSAAASAMRRQGSSLDQAGELLLDSLVMLDGSFQAHFVYCRTSHRRARHVVKHAALISLQAKHGITLQHSRFVLLLLLLLLSWVPPNARSAAQAALTACAFV